MDETSAGQPGDAGVSAVELRATKIVLRPYGSPLPLGFFSFAVGMALLAGIALDVITGDQVRTAGVLLAAFVFPLEFLAAVFAFLARDTGAATALAIFSTSWAGIGALYVIAPLQQRSTSEGMYLCAFALVLLPLAAVALLGKALLGVVLTVSTIRAVLAAAYQLGAPHELELANAAAALLLVGFAVYAGTAFLIEDARQRTLLPILRRGDAGKALQDDLVAEHARLTREPGVRRQL
jgi:succinate-acetate transporter protein